MNKAAKEVAAKLCHNKKEKKEVYVDFNEEPVYKDVEDSRSF